MALANLLVIRLERVSVPRHLCRSGGDLGQQHAHPASGIIVVITEGSLLGGRKIQQRLGRGRARAVLIPYCRIGVHGVG